MVKYKEDDLLTSGVQLACTTVLPPPSNGDVELYLLDAY